MLVLIGLLAAAFRCLLVAWCGINSVVMIVYRCCLFWIINLDECLFVFVVLFLSVLL